MKRVFLFLFVFSTVLAIGQIDLNNGLILYYPLDGNANDFGPGNLDGIPSVNWAPDYQGNSSGAAQFNGSDTYIDFPEDLSLKPQLPVSFSFYVRLNSPNVQQGWIFSTNYSQNTYRGIFCNIDNAKIQFSIGDGDLNSTSSSARRTKTVTKPLNIGQWYHIVGVVRGLSDMSIYVDCTDEPGTYSGTGGNINYNSDPGSIGRGDITDISPYYFNGGLDDFRYWNRALSEEEVTALCELVARIENATEDNQFSVTIGPNPAHDFIAVHFSRDFNNARVQYEIRNMQGQVVTTGNPKLQQGSNSMLLDVKLLPAGFYYLHIRSEAGSLIKKIIIE